MFTDKLGFKNKKIAYYIVFLDLRNHREIMAELDIIIHK